MKTRIITAVVGLIVLAGVLFTFDTLVFNLVIAAITLIALHEIYSALGFEKQDWPLLAVLVPYTLLIMLSSYSVFRAMVMPASFLVVLFYAIYLVVRNGVISYQKASGLAMFSGIVIFCLLVHPAQGDAAGGGVWLRRHLLHPAHPLLRLGRRYLRLLRGPRLWQA